MRQIAAWNVPIERLGLAQAALHVQRAARSSQARLVHSLAISGYDEADTRHASDWSFRCRRRGGHRSPGFTRLNAPRNETVAFGVGEL